jgi:hypothetical protein
MYICHFIISPLKNPGKNEPVNKHALFLFPTETLRQIECGSLILALEITHGAYIGKRFNSDPFSIERYKKYFDFSLA